MQLETSKKIIAISMLVNDILNSDEPKNKSKWPQVCSKSVKHLKEKMQFDVKPCLPAAMQEVVAADSTAPKAGTSSKSKQQTNPKAVQLHEVIQESAQQQVEPPKKKLRKFSKPEEAA